jgi:hypothetical protein
MNQMRFTGIGNLADGPNLAWLLNVRGWPFLLIASGT